MSLPSLDYFPSELLLMIFQRLQSRETCSCLRVNKRFNGIIEQNRHILYKTTMVCIWIEAVNEKTLNLTFNQRNYLPFQIQQINKAPKRPKLCPLTFLTSYLETYKTSKKSRFYDKKVGKAYRTDEIDVTFREVLSFILRKVHMVHLNLNCLSTIQLDIVIELVPASRCSINYVHLTCDDQFGPAEAQTISLPIDGIYINYPEEWNYKDDPFRMSNIERLKTIKFETDLECTMSSVYIGNYLRELLVVVELNVLKPWYITIEDLLFIFKEWSTEARVIEIYKFRVNCSQQYLRKAVMMTKFCEVVDTSVEGSENSLNLTRRTNGATLKLWMNIENETMTSIQLNSCTWRSYSNRRC